MNGVKVRLLAMMSLGSSDDTVGYTGGQVYSHVKHQNSDTPIKIDDLLSAQHDLDVAYADMHEIKSDGVKEMMNHENVMTPSGKPTDPGANLKASQRRPDTLKTVDPKLATLMPNKTGSSTNNPWKHWFFIAKFVKPNTVDHELGKNKAIKNPGERITDSFELLPSGTKNTLCEFLQQILCHSVKSFNVEADELRQILLACDDVTADLNTIDHNPWKKSNAGHAIWQHLTGLFFEFEPMKTRPFVPDHRFEQYNSCRKITQCFYNHPMILTISKRGLKHHIMVKIYPRRQGENKGCMLVGTNHINGLNTGSLGGAFSSARHVKVEDNDASLRKIVDNDAPVHQEAPGRAVHDLQPTVIDNDCKALTRDVSNHVREKDAAAMLVIHTRRYRDKIVQKYIACHCMRVVLEKPASDIRDLHLLSAADILQKYSEYWDMNKGEFAVRLFESMVYTDDDTSTQNMYFLTCTGGTIDCFSNDKQHIDMSLHTNNNLVFKFTYNGVDTNIRQKLSVSMYATYYPGGNLIRTEK
jgi:hypothetical protein